MQDSKQNDLWKLPKEVLIKIILQTNDFDKLSFKECKHIHKKLKKIMEEKKLKGIREGLYRRLNESSDLEEWKALDDTIVIDIKDFIYSLSIGGNDGILFVYTDTDGKKYTGSIRYTEIENEIGDTINPRESARMNSIYNNFLCLFEILSDDKFRRNFYSFYSNGEENANFKF